MPMSRLPALALMVIAVAACGSSSAAGRPPTSSPSPATCDPIYAAQNLAPSQLEKTVCLPQDLTFSGEVAGQARVAEVATQCTTSLGRGAPLPAPEFHVIVAGILYQLKFSPTETFTPPETTVTVSQPQAVRPTVGLVDEASAKAGLPSAWGSAKGTLTFKADGVSGSIDLDVLRDVQGSRSTHISGDWQCGAAASPQPSSQSGAPCSAIAASNGLSPADAAHIASAPCIAQDLAVTGALNGHVSEGVPVGTATDPGGKSCGDGANSDGLGYFYAPVAFAIASDTVFLRIEMRREAALGPKGPFPAGTYPARYESSNVMFPAAIARTGALKWESSAGQFTIAPDKHSGTIDLEFAAPDTQPGIHIKGNWRCAQ